MCCDVDQYLVLSVIDANLIYDVLVVLGRCNVDDHYLEVMHQVWVVVSYEKI